MAAAPPPRGGHAPRATTECHCPLVTMREPGAPVPSPAGVPYTSAGAAQYSLLDVSEEVAPVVPSSDVCSLPRSVGKTDEEEPSPQLHCRNIGVEGWDGTDEGRGTYEDKDKLCELFSAFGEVLQATVRHRIHSDGRGGRTNTSWALVTMLTAESATRAIESGVTIGSTKLKLTRFNESIAGSSTGGMTAVHKTAKVAAKKASSERVFFTDVNLFAVKLYRLRKIQKAGLRTDVRNIPVFTDKEWQAASVDSSWEEEDRAQDRLNAELNTWSTSALRRRAVELGVEEMQVRPECTDRDAVIELIRESKPVQQRTLALNEEYTDTVLQFATQGESLPPGWLMPPDTTKNLGVLVEELDLLRGQPRLHGHPVWGAPSQRLQWDERWLYWWVWRNLDCRGVCYPVYIVFVALASLSPEIVYNHGHYGSTPGKDLDIVLLMHAVGVAFLWLGFAFLFHNLRSVVRARTAFLRTVATEFGVTDKQLQRCVNRNSIINQIVHQYEHDWPNTQRMLLSKEEYKRTLHHIEFVQTVYRLKLARREQAEERQPNQLVDAVLKRGRYAMRTKNNHPGHMLDNDHAAAHESKRKTIQSCKLFRSALGEGHVASQVYDEVAKLALLKYYQKGQAIVLEGAIADNLFLIQSGEAASYHINTNADGHEWTCSFGPNSCFGEAALLEHSHGPRRRATVVAILPTVCLVFKPSTFRYEKRTEASNDRKHRFSSFTHIQDRRIRLLLNAVVEMKSSQSTASSIRPNVNELRKWTQERSARIGEPLPPDATFSDIMKVYLHHTQDCCPPEGGLGGFGNVVDDHVSSRAKYPMAKLRWNAYTLQKIRDKFSYAGDKKQMHQPALFTHDDISRIQKQRRYISAYALLMYANLHAYCLTYLHRHPSDWHFNTTEVIVYLAFILGSTIACIVFVAWFCSLLLAVALVKDAIRDLHLQIYNWARNQGAQANHKTVTPLDTWELQVHSPAVELAHYLLPALSAWSGGIGPTFICSWLFCFLSLPMAARCWNNDGSSFFERYFGFVTSVLWGLVPVLQLYGPATISTSTANLLNQLNELRAVIYHPSVTSQYCARAGRLVDYLNSCNSNHGAGFVMFHMVISLNFLKEAAAAGGAVGATILATLTQYGKSF